MTTSDSVVENPDVKLEDIREERLANKCVGRGAETASGRGYNIERLATSVFIDRDYKFLWDAEGNWFDTFSDGGINKSRVECKGCVDRYPSGGFGRFRLWRKNHRLLLAVGRILGEFSPESLYFFVVYTIENDIEKEVGKLVVSAEQIEEIVDDWSLRDHPSMGQEFARDISWNMLLTELDISRERFKEQEIVDLTDF